MKEGYAEVMDIPPSEFYPREWEADYTTSPSPMPCFEILFDMIGGVAAVCWVRLRGDKVI